MKDEDLNKEFQVRSHYIKKTSKWNTFWNSVWVSLKNFWKENITFRK
ncbi:MAG TPA: hypothetical protein VLH94_03220 [Spirochaetia bacterium]|nr:hypothetical protein [Spirochaetia bacterium]